MNRMPNRAEDESNLFFFQPWVLQWIKRKEKNSPSRELSRNFLLKNKLVSTTIKHKPYIPHDYHDHVPPIWKTSLFESVLFLQGCPVQRVCKFLFKNGIKDIRNFKSLLQLILGQQDKRAHTSACLVFPAGMAYTGFLLQFYLFFLICKAVSFSVICSGTVFPIPICHPITHQQHLFLLHHKIYTEKNGLLRSSLCLKS